MAGPRLFHRRKNNSRSELGESLPNRRGSKIASFMKYFLATTFGLSTLTSGSNINNLGANSVMAAHKRRRTAVEEDRAYINQQALEAAKSYKKYLLEGNENDYKRFWDIYNKVHDGIAMNQNADFTHPFFDELSKIREDPVIKQLLNAYKEDRERFPGLDIGVPIPIITRFLQGTTIEPILATEFIETVHKIRTTVSEPSYHAVQDLKLQVQAQKGKPVKADTPVGRVRALMDEGMDLDGAARKELQRENVRKAGMKYGERLVDKILATRPEEQARIGVEAFREFMLTGDTAKKEEFRNIWNTNTSDIFTQAFLEHFRYRVYDDLGTDGKPSQLSLVARAYAEKHNGIDPIQFANDIVELYDIATTKTKGNEAQIRRVKQEMQRMRREHGREVINPLLDIVARGKARRAILLMDEVLRTGSQKASTEFMGILNGEFLAMPMEQNDVFRNEFGRLYMESMDRNNVLRGVERDYKMNTLPIAIREIYTELARETPDMAALQEKYFGTQGAALITLLTAESKNLGWFVKNRVEINREIERRNATGDHIVQGLLGIEVADRGAAIAEAYPALIDERIKKRTIESIDIIEPNYADLSWLSGNAAQVQAQINRRARAGNANAITMRSRYGADAGTILSQAYAEYTALKERRDQLVQKHGEKFVDYLSKNLDHLNWALRPIEEIDTILQAKSNDAFVIEMHQATGHSYGTLAHALRDIYRNPGERERLVRSYGEELVQVVESNRADLDWLNYDVGTIRGNLISRDDDLTNRLKEGIYAYHPIQLIAAMAKARQSINRGGLALEDATDALGKNLIDTATGIEAAAVRPIIPEEMGDKRVAIIATCDTIESEIRNIERQLSYKVMEPAKALLSERMRLWRAENNRIREEAQEPTLDDIRSSQLIEDQKTLRDSMLSSQDLRKSVEMAFAIMHLVETGGDLSWYGPASTDYDITLGTVRTLLQWYDGYAGTGKQTAIEEIVSTIMSHANPELYSFIGSRNRKGFTEALDRTYALTQGRGVDIRAALEATYGTEFVSLVYLYAPGLGVLSSAEAEKNLGMGENELFAATVTRCYRAITNPQENENKELMVQLFGQEFVNAVEANKAHLGALTTPGAGLDELKTIPKDAREALMKVYPLAYKKSMVKMMRAYTRQDEAVMHAASAIYYVLRDAPADDASNAKKEDFKNKVAALKSTYGEALVELIRANIEIARPVLESPTKGIMDLPPQMIDDLHTAFEAGPAFARANFMENYKHLAVSLPRVYTVLKNALKFDTSIDQVGRDFGEALELYKREFGENYYLLDQFINLELLTDEKLKDIAREYNIYIPEDITDPDAFAKFLNTPEGQSFITMGRQFYDKIEIGYLREKERISQKYEAERETEREEAGLGPGEEISSTAVRNLRNSLSVLDAVYLGLVLDKVGAATSSFGNLAAMEMVNTLVQISNRDPYLVGPFILHVLPAIIEVSPDERTIIMLLSGFRGMFTARYNEGQRQVGYTDSMNRNYFLEVFREIGTQLPEKSTIYGWRGLSDETRLVAPSGPGDWNYENPLYFHPRDTWWEQPQRNIPNFFTAGQPFDIMPRPWIPGPYNPIPGREVPVESDALGKYSRDEDQLTMRRARRLGLGVPPEYPIGAMGATTALHILYGCFGPIPIDYQDYVLGAHAEAGMFYAAEGAEVETAEGEGTTTTFAGGGGGAGTYRTITGGGKATLIGEERGTTTELTTTAEEGEEAEELALKSSETKVEYRGQAAGVQTPLPTVYVPLPLLQLSPSWGAFEHDSQVGLIRADEYFHYETNKSTVAVENEDGEIEYREVQTSERTRGVLDSYRRIATGEHGDEPVDMLVYISGDYKPELVPPTGGAEEEVEGPPYQEEEGRLKGRLYFINKKGDIYQLGFGLDTETQLNNYLFAGANTQQVLAELKFVGRHMLKEESALSGFDGAALGFNLSREESDNISALLFGEVQRRIATEEPVNANQVVATAVTNLLEDKAQRDIFAAFYRGGETVQVDPENPNKLDYDATAHAKTSVEVMWRRVRIKPMEHAHELRLVGGATGAGERKTPVLGGMWKHEIPVSESKMYAYGISGAYSEVDLLREFRVIEEETEQMFSNLRTWFVDAYGWTEDEARDTGWLVAANYMNSRLKDWVEQANDANSQAAETGEEPKQINPHYGTGLLMYWAKRHGFLAGIQKAPGYTDIYNKIENAMNRIQQNPEYEDQILEELTNSLRKDFEKDLWRFALGYGFDGERWSMHILASGEFMEEERITGVTETGEIETEEETELHYANLGALFVFDQPPLGAMDIVGHAYRYSPLVISMNESDELVATRNDSVYFTDLQFGANLFDFPSLDLMRYETAIPMVAEVDIAGALRDAYGEIGSSAYNGQRLVHLYSRTMADLVSEGSQDLEWMVRSPESVAAVLKTKVEAEDPLARSLMAERFGDRMTKLTDENYLEVAEMLVDVYKEVRRPERNLEALQKKYVGRVVDKVMTNTMELEWMLLPPDEMRTQFARKAQVKDSVEWKLANFVELPEGVKEEELTGREVQKMCEQNLAHVLAALLREERVTGLKAERYDVVLASNLSASDERSDKYYVMLSPVKARPYAKGSVLIGNEDDYKEWRGKGWTIGAGVHRLEIKKEAGKYNFVFSGKRGLRAFTDARLIGGLTLPMEAAEYDRYKIENNWTVGGLVRLLQDHQNDWITGALYGIREFGAEQWHQLTITESFRHKLAMTETYSDQVFWYVFFNKTTKKIVIASDDVFENDEELEDVSVQLGTDMKELQRTTGGVGVTWARTNVITGQKISLHFFFEGGLEEITDYGVQEETGYEFQFPTGEKELPVITPTYGPYEAEEFVFRSGLNFTWSTQPTRSTGLGTSWTLGVVGARGNWPLVPGIITRPEYLDMWANELGTYPWYIMALIRASF